MFKQIKMRTVALVIGIMMTFGLIAAAAPSLPADAETIVTAEQQGAGDGGGRGDRDGRGNRDGRRGDRGSRGDRGPDIVEAFFDF